MQGITTPTQGITAPTKGGEIEAPAPDIEGETLAQDMIKTEGTTETKVLTIEVIEVTEKVGMGGGSMAMAMRSEGTAQGP